MGGGLKINIDQMNMSNAVEVKWQSGAGKVGDFDLEDERLSLHFASRFFTPWMALDWSQFHLTTGQWPHREASECWTTCSSTRCQVDQEG